MIIYEKVFRRFQKEKIGYIVVGGIAANLLGMMRTTADLDILIAVDSKNLIKIHNTLRNLNYKIKQPIDIQKLNKKSLKHLIKTKNLKAINYFKTSEISEVDIIIDSPISFEKAKKRAKSIAVGKLKLPVISIDDLIKMKSKTGRAVDKFDVLQLKRIKRLVHG